MKELNSIQIEQLKHIGAYLLQVREQNIISLEKIAQETFIPLRLLKALEKGEIDRLPEPVYVKGFIRRYADALGLNGAEVAASFELNTAPVHQTSPTTTTETISTPSPAPPSDAFASEPAQGSRFAIPPGFAVAGVLTAIVGAIALTGFGVISFISASQVSSFKATQAQTKSASQQTAPTSSQKPNSDPEANPTSSPTQKRVVTANSTPKASPVETEKNASVKVDVSLKDDSWMEVLVDGKVKFEGTLAKGTQRTWTAQNTLQIRAGNAGAVIASYNQGQAKPLGQLGDVVSADFPPKR